VIGADVGDEGGVAAVRGEAAAEDPAAGGLEDGDVDVGAAEDEAGGCGAGPVSWLDDALVDGDPVGGGVAWAQAGAADDAGEQARAGGLAVGAGDEGDGDRAELGPGDLVGRWELA
jgi:hypothetical protein